MFFLYFDQSDSNLSVKKIWVYRLINFSKNGPEVQATLTRSVSVTKTTQPV